MHTASGSWGSRGRRPSIACSSRSRARSGSGSQSRVRGCVCAASWRWAVGRTTLTWVTRSAFSRDAGRGEPTKRENTAIRSVVIWPLPKARLPTRTCRAEESCYVLTGSRRHEKGSESRSSKARQRSQNAKVDRADCSTTWSAGKAKENWNRWP